MKRKMLCFVLAAAVMCVLLSSCAGGEIYAKYTELQPDDSGTVTILTLKVV